jgi:hypothetical protein
MERMAEALTEKAAESQKQTINPMHDYCRDRPACQGRRRDRQVTAYSLPERGKKRKKRGQGGKTWDIF